MPESVDRFTWERLVKATRLPATVKAVAWAAAMYAKADGSGVRPGVARLAADCSLSERSTRAALATLREQGWLERTVTGSAMGRRALTDEHRLTRSPATRADDHHAGSPAGGADDHPEQRHDVPVITPDHRQMATGSPANGDRITGTTCTPTDQEQPKIIHAVVADQSNLLTVGGSTSDDVDLVEIARAVRGDEHHARRVAHDVLARAKVRPADPTAYVLAAVRADPARHRSHAGNPGQCSTHLTPLPCSCCAADRKASRTADDLDVPSLTARPDAKRGAA